MKDKALYLIAGLVAGALLYFIFVPSPEPVEYTNVIVREIKEPDTVRTFIDRIVYRDRQPELVATEPGGATDVVEDFCKPDTVVQVIEGDTIYVPADTVYLLRSVVHYDKFWFWQRDGVGLFGPTSAGDLREMRFESWPGWSVRTDPELLFREPRFGLLRELSKQVPSILAGILLGRVLF